MSKIIDVVVTVDLPVPYFRGIRHGRVVYVALPDVLELLEDTASAFDSAHANSDIGKSFRALAATINEAPEKSFS